MIFDYYDERDAGPIGRVTRTAAKNNFQRELQSLLEKYALGKSSNTPECVLAEHVMGCLTTFGTTARQRDNWHHGRSMIS